MPDIETRDSKPPDRRGPWWTISYLLPLGLAVVAWNATGSVVVTLIVVALVTAVIVAAGDKKGR